MSTLEFNGEVADGCGRFEKVIGLPDDLLHGQEEWVSELVPGTLNIRFSVLELPLGFHTDGLRFLDLNCDFPPSVYRKGADIQNNTIKPDSDNRYRGDLQLWRATLVNHQTDTKHRCFLARRVGSGYTDVAEILGEHNFREEWGFRNGQKVTVTLHHETLET